MPKEWTEEEEKFLKLKHEDLTNAQLAEALGVSTKSIEAKLRRLKLKRKRKGAPKKTARREKTAIVAKPVEDEHRVEAVREFDKGVRLWVEGKDSEAMAQLKRVAAEYASVFDVAWAAKFYLERCRSLGQSG